MGRSSPSVARAPPGVLNKFQREIIAVVTEATSRERFALAGGAALMAKGLVDRETQDLDFFAREPEAVGRVVESVEAALHSADMVTHRVIEAAHFVRIEIVRGEDHSELDLGHDSGIRPQELSPFGPILATEELAADKTLGIVRACRSRRFIDVYVLARHFGERMLWELVAEKDAGFDRSRLAEALRSLGRLDREQFEVDDEAYEKMGQWTRAWAHDLDREIAKERGLGVEPGRSPDRGPELPDP